MLVALAFFAGDRNQAVRFSDWINEIGDYGNHKLLIVRDKGADKIPGLGSTFGSVEEIVVTNDAWNKWPESCNNAFQQSARYIDEFHKVPWLWVEPDCIVLKPSWLDDLEAEYIRGGKPFMGDRVRVENVPEHASGIAVYPPGLARHAGLALIAHETAWDVQAASQIVPHTHWTNLISHKWKHPPIQNQSEFENLMSQLPKECVLFHADKSGSIYSFLRKARTVSSGSTQIVEPVFQSPKSSGSTVVQSEKIDPNSSPDTSPTVLTRSFLSSSSDLAGRIETERLTEQKLNEIHNQLLPKPWENKKESEREVALLCEALALFCGAPVYKKRVRDALRKVNIIPK